MSSTCVAAETAPFKISVTEADELVKKSPSFSEGPGLETEGNSVRQIVPISLITHFLCFQLTNGTTCTCKNEPAAAAGNATFPVFFKWCSFR